MVMVKGVADGTQVSVYIVSGIQAGSVVSRGGTALINTHLQPGSVAIVKIGTKSVRVVVR